MKVLIISTEFPPGPGGIGAHTHNLAANLAVLGHRVTVVAPQDYVTPAQAADFRQGLAFDLVVPGGTGRLVRGATRVATIQRTLRTFRPDVVIASGGTAVAVAGLLCRGVPLVAIGHGTEFAVGGRVGRALIGRGFARADRVICVSAYTEGELLRSGIHPRSSVVIHNGADPALASQGLDEPGLGTSVPGVGSSPVILTVGNVTERKGQEVVVRAMPAVLDAVPDAHYVAVGLPTDAAELEALARSLGVGDHVHFAGALGTEALAAAYRSCTVLAMVSRHTSSGDFEGFGIAAVEAGLFAKPAVVSDSGGLPEAVLDGVTGLVASEDDPASTAAALVRVLRDPVLARRLGEAAAARVHDELTWQAVTARYDAELRALTGPPVPTGTRLVIVSDTPHYLIDGQVMAWAPTAREIDVLAGVFDEVTHVSPLYHHDGERSATRSYEAPNVRLRFVHRAGGERLLDKLDIVRSMLGWSRALSEELRDGALLHVRAPSSLAIHAYLWCLVHGRKVHWSKYGANWMPSERDVWSYELQRFILRRLLDTPVSVNGTWPAQPARVRAFVNPTFTTDELAAAAALAEGKELEGTVRMLFVGRLDAPKGAHRAIEVARRLTEDGHEVHLDLVGSGDMAAVLPEMVADGGLTGRVTLHGWLPPAEVAALYAAAHVMVLPTEREGFPKVVSEAMAYGAVPIAGAISSIPMVLSDLGVGHAVDPLDVQAFVDVIEGYVADPATWAADSKACLAAAQRFSFDTYLGDVRLLFAEEWGVELPTGPPGAGAP